MPSEPLASYLAQSGYACGLSGPSMDARSLTAAMLAPCPNIAFAARQIAPLRRRCKTVARFKADPIYCAITAYHGSWEQPDTMFADAVKATVVKGDAPNFSMPQDAYFDSGDIGSDALAPDRDGAPTAPAVTSDNREHGWSSALPRASPPQANTASADMPNHDRAESIAFAFVLRVRLRQRPIHRATVCLCRDRLTGDRDESSGHVSQDVARFRMFEC
jgi:hypothetical protein